MTPALSEQDIEKIVAAEIKDARDMLNNRYLGKKLRKAFLKLHSVKPKRTHEPDP
jgi:hypothetical protein